ncbi:MAG: OmpA family protein [Bacteroidetes bacterium]|nr:OmpA family protein [Bacteroidota bacterium]
MVLRVHAKNAYTKQDIPAIVSIFSTADDRLLAEGNREAEIRLDLQKWYTATGELSGYENKVASLRFDTADEVTKMAKDEGERMVITHDLLMIPIFEDERKIYAFTVEFDFNLFNIRPEEERKLDSAVVLLTQFPNSTVVVSGHTDSVGTVIYNIKLGYSRAKEVSRYVQDWLYQKGVKLQNEMEIRTYGEAEPVASNSTDEGRQKNRRVEIAIVRNQ